MHLLTILTVVRVVLVQFFHPTEDSVLSAAPPKWPAIAASLAIALRTQSPLLRRDPDCDSFAHVFGTAHWGLAGRFHVAYPPITTPPTGAHTAAPQPPPILAGLFVSACFVMTTPVPLRAVLAFAAATAARTRNVSPFLLFCRQLALPVIEHLFSASVHATSVEAVLPCELLRQALGASLGTAHAVLDVSEGVHALGAEGGWSAQAQGCVKAAAIMLLASSQGAAMLALERDLSAARDATQCP